MELRGFEHLPHRVFRRLHLLFSCQIRVQNLCFGGPQMEQFLDGLSKLAVCDKILLSQHSFANENQLESV